MSDRTIPSSRLLIALPLLALVVAISALGAGFVMDEVTGLMLALISMGGALGVVLVGALAGQVERSCEKPVTHIAGLLRSHHLTPEPGALNFEAAVVSCGGAIARSAPGWLLLCLAPALMMSVAVWAIPAGLFQALALGLGLGATLLGTSLELLLNSGSRNAWRALSSLTFVACLAQALWLLTAGSFPS